MCNDIFGFDLDYVGTTEAQRHAMYAQQAASRQSMANAGAQQAQQSAYAQQTSFLGGLVGGGSDGYMGAFGMCGTVDEQNAETSKTGSRIGKITPKPGYIRDYGSLDLVRVKVKTDYTWPERFYLWWNNVEFDKDGAFKV